MSVDLPPPAPPAAAGFDLPLLDLRLLRARDPAALAVLRRAAHATGFLLVTGTGLEGARTGEVLGAARALLALPEEAKQAAASVDSPQFRGWTRVGAELTGGRPDAREQMDFGREEPPVSGSAVGLRLRGPNRWPAADGADALAATVLAWLSDAERVGHELLDALLAALGLPADTVDPLLVEDGARRGHLHGKLLRYPPEPHPSGQGVGAHKDYGFLALLVQDGVGGLQAKLPDADDVWVDLAPRDDALVINLGEMLEILTDGYLVATPHRVLSPQARERHSVAVFLGPRLDAVVRPVELPAGLAAGARGRSADPDNPLLADYGANSLKGWLRAHPETARRHHPDLVADRP